jgi:multidrug efflux system outer membrane protein
MKFKSLVCVLLLQGCSLAPPYSPPPDCPPLEWKEQDERGISLSQVDPWWLVFEDSTLTELIETAIEQNPTLIVAFERIMEARGVAESASSGLYPQLFLDPDGMSMGTVVKGPTGVTRAHIQSYSFPFDLSYELDLFQKIRNQSRAAYLNIDVKSYDYAGVYLALTTDVATSYFSCRSLDAQIEVLTDTIQSRQAQVEITTARFNAGLVNYTDVSRALNEVATAKADLETAEQLRREQENAIASLLGYYASEYRLPKQPLQEEAPLISADLPSELLMRRPDVASAESFLHEQNQLIGVAMADYFPDVLINGTLGFASLDWGSLFDWKSRLWAYGYQITQLVFDGGRVSGEVQAQKARYLQALGSYIQTTLTAFQETENALSGQTHSRAKFVLDREAVVAAQDTRSLSYERYLKGLVTYLDVVDAERTLLSNRLEMERSRFLSFQSTILLIKALGGGF